MCEARAATVAPVLRELLKQPHNAVKHWLAFLERDAEAAAATCAALDLLRDALDEGAERERSAASLGAQRALLRYDARLAAAAVLFVALLAIAEGLRGSGAADPDPAAAPAQPVLIATGSRDAILEGSKALAAACPQGRFIEIPDRHHFNAPGSRDFRAAAREFLAG